MSQRIATTATVIGAGAATMTLLATVSPHVASSNISKWLTHLNISSPALLRSPDADIVARWGALAVLLLISGYWVVRWSDRSFTSPREAFSIEEAADMISACERTLVRRHGRNHEVRNELLNLVSEGRIPLANEKPDHALRLRTLAEGDMRQHAKKIATLNMRLSKETLEAVAKGRNWPFPAL